MTTKVPERLSFFQPWHFLLSSAAALCMLPFLAQADTVEMQNGDRYVGKVLLLNTNTLFLQSQVLGTVQLPRSQVATISLAPGARTNFSRLVRTNSPARAAAVARTNPNPDSSAMLRQLGLSTNLIQQVQRQFLSDANPEARDKYNELVGGLMSGKLTVDDIRSEAKSAAGQLRGMKRELGEEAGWAVDVYLRILDGFLKESAPVGGAATNAPATLPKAGSLAAEEEN